MIPLKSTAATHLPSHVKTEELAAQSNAIGRAVAIYHLQCRPSISTENGVKPYNRAQHGAILRGLQVSQDVKMEISNALASGKEVTVQERDVSVGGWSGSGYLILDPLSGGGRL